MGEAASPRRAGLSEQNSVDGANEPEFRYRVAGTGNRKAARRRRMKSASAVPSEVVASLVESIWNARQGEKKSFPGRKKNLFWRVASLGMTPRNRNPRRPKHFLRSIAIRAALSASNFYETIRATCFARILGTERPVSQIVCYGVGSPRASQTARFQVALALLIKDLFAPSNGTHAFDPIFEDVDKEALTELGIIVILENENAKRTVDGRTLFYMPHCEQELYDNVLSANWEPEKLVDVVILGNRFEVYSERLSDAQFRRKSPYIHAVSKRTTTFLFPEGLFEHPDVFNDTCVHTFIPEHFPAKPLDRFWLLDLPPPPAAAAGDSGREEIVVSKWNSRRWKGRNGPIEAARAVARGDI